MRIKFQKTSEKIMNNPVINNYYIYCDDSEIYFGDLLNKFKLVLLYQDIPKRLNPCNFDNLNVYNFRESADKLGMTYAHYFHELVKACRGLSYSNVTESECDINL